MELKDNQVAMVERDNTHPNGELRDLSDLQLALVGGGIGDVIFG